MKSISLLERYGYVIFQSNLRHKYLDYRNQCSEWLHDQLKSMTSKSIPNVDLGLFHENLQETSTDLHDFISYLPKKRYLPEHLVLNDYINSVVVECSKLLDQKFKLHDKTVFFRICRPGHDDSNDLHRDTWFTNYEGLLNLYVPLSGSYNDSALKIVPFSHNWSDDDIKPNITPGGTNKYYKNGVAYSAPTIGFSKNKIKPHRPDVLEGDYMIFNPRIVHGGADNQSLETRISLEFRIEHAD